MTTGKAVVRRWFVASGPDSRHLQEVTAHTTAGAAKDAYASRQAKAKQLFSLDFEPWEGGKNKRVLKEVIA